MAPRKVVIRPAPGRGKGYGMFANELIHKGERIYPLRRLRMSRSQCEAFVSAHMPATSKLLLMYGWGEGESYVLPLGVEVFVNHCASRPNSVNGVAQRDIRPGEEILENYAAYDTCEPWYIALAKRFKVWLACR